MTLFLIKIFQCVGCSLINIIHFHLMGWHWQWPWLWQRHWLQHWLRQRRLWRWRWLVASFAAAFTAVPIGGHLQAKEKGEDPKQPGERQWKLSLVRQVCQGRGTGNCERQDPVEERHYCGPMPHWGQQGLMMMTIHCGVADGTGSSGINIYGGGGGGISIDVGLPARRHHNGMRLCYVFTDLFPYGWFKTAYEKKPRAGKTITRPTCI